MIGSLAPQGMKVVVHDGHLAVPVIFNGTACHDARNAAAGSNQHGDERLAGQTELAENPVHDECDPGHITAGLKERQEDEQHQHLWNKAQHSANAGNNTIQDQAGQPAGTAHRGQESFYQHRYSVYFHAKQAPAFPEHPVIGPVSCPGATIVTDT